MHETNKEHLVTFIVPVHNNQNYLSDCLTSIANQSHGYGEIIIIDDNSSDLSLEIAEEFALVSDKVQLIKHDYRLGAGQARNRGIHESRGQYIRFVDADDLIPLNSTSQLLERALVTTAQLVRGSLYTFRDNNFDAPELTVQIPDVHYADYSTNKELCIPWWHTSYLYDATFLRDRKILYPSLSLGEDPVFLAECIAHATRISFTSEIVYMYRKYSKTTGSFNVELSAIKDQLAHYSCVKKLHQESCPSCWDDYYAEICWKNFNGILKRTSLSNSDLKAIEETASRIWPENTHKS